MLKDVDSDDRYRLTKAEIEALEKSGLPANQLRRIRCNEDLTDVLVEWIEKIASVSPEALTKLHNLMEAIKSKKSPLDAGKK